MPSPLPSPFLIQVTYTNVLLPLEELEAHQFQLCVSPKFVSAEAERRIDIHVSACRHREDVYCVVKAWN
ncbi:hypothetical protein L2E82_44794 [Cichorium intybus]|uniref:Uncharacterized protein n=1 Tax=Cichorium intybus TaxID=13427 RepID=A0ACB8ZSI4_CICIN|nr:hypothetical protein L2E82_44794 [Cichorium intybus]